MTRLHRALYLALAPTCTLALACSAPDELGETVGARNGVPNAESDRFGTIAVFYEETETYADLADALAGSGVFEAVSASVASVIALPADLEAIFHECGDANAYYQDGQIGMCYEFFDLFTEIFLEHSEDPATVFHEVLGTGVFFYLHEIGHALVDQLQIPVTGREEDSVDALATMILLLGGSENALFSAVGNFSAMAAVSESQAILPLWGEHSLDSQRLYDIVCLIYGSDPEAWAHLVAPELLPEERARRCPTEFAQKSLSWDRLLSPYYR